MTLKVCAVTGSRADWGLLRVPLSLIRDDPAFDLVIVATGSHLSSDFGDTVAEIEGEGFTVAARVPVLDGGDDARAVTQAIGRGVIGFADVLAELRPDLMLVLGDRFEILAAVQAALIARVPVGHLCGGDVTEGAFDDAIRHAITKMAHLHFVTNEAAARRVRAMGERPESIHLTGSPGLDSIRELTLLPRDEVFARLGLAPRPRTLLVTFHPATLDEDSAAAQLRALLEALADLGDEVGLVLTGSNADTQGRLLTRLAEAFAAEHDNAVFRLSLGQLLYLSTMAQADAVIGNSSSGLYEAPSFKIPTVNIGDRQGGRLKAASVIDCAPERGEIARAIVRALDLDCSQVINPYGDGHAGERILQALKQLGDPKALLKKGFCDLESGAVPSWPRA